MINSLSIQYYYLCALASTRQDTVSSFSKQAATIGHSKEYGDKKRQEEE